MTIKILFFTTAICVFIGGCNSQIKPKNATQNIRHPPLWQADLGDGTYQNPILYADYSDPDVVAIGDEFYMTASSFNASPGLPILHSTDLVNWELIGNVVTHNRPQSFFKKPQHGNGIWAPCIRYHAGKVWIFYPDPDFGIYMTNTKDPRGQWSEPKLILPGKGIIDPTPLWDDDGQAYLLHGWAKSRSGINNILTLHQMSVDGTQVDKQGETIIDGHKIPGYITLEGPKFYKRNGYYYIFAPAGGVPVGWQSVFRAKHIEGPYEDKIVMEQGDTSINGPHQGGWVTTPAGEDWFVHFQSRYAYGRIVHLQPMKWVNDWPVIGADDDGDGIGFPVHRYTKPKTQKLSTVKNLPFTDDFSTSALGPQWHWAANVNKSWYSLTARENHLRLYAQHWPLENKNMWMQPAILQQRLPAPAFITETTFELPDNLGNVTAGLTMFGEDYFWIGFQNNKSTGEIAIGIGSCHNARKGCNESFRLNKRLKTRKITLRMTVTEGGATVFSFLDSTGRYRAIGELFQARPGRWVGAKIGLFIRSTHNETLTANDYIDVDYLNLFAPSH